MPLFLKPKIDKKISNLKPDSIDFTKEIPVYIIKATEKPKTTESKTETPETEKKIHSREIRRNLLKQEIKLLRSNFNEFYFRTKTNNPQYFGSSFLTLIEVLDENIKKLQVSNSFSSYVLKQYNYLKGIVRKSKEYMKKINLIFEEARKNKKSNPSKKSVSYGVGFITNLESTSGEALENTKREISYFNIIINELKGQISSYHPITKAKEELSLAKDCEKNWIIYVEACRQEKQLLKNRMTSKIESFEVQENKIQTSLKNPTATPTSNLENSNKERKKNKKIKEKNNEEILKEIEGIEEIHEKKNDYDSAFEALKISLKESVNSKKLSKEDKEDIEKELKNWNDKNSDWKKLDDIKYEYKTTAEIKRVLKKGLDFFHTTVNKVKGVKADVDTAKSILSSLS